MAATMELTEAVIVDALSQKIRKESQEILDEVLVEANAELQRRLAGVADTMALDVLSYYDIRQREGQIVITVKKPT